MQRPAGQNPTCSSMSDIVLKNTRQTAEITNTSSAYAFKKYPKLVISKLEFPSHSSSIYQNSFYCQPARESHDLNIDFRSYLRNEFYFLNVHGIVNTSGLSQSK